MTLVPVRWSPAFLPAVLLAAVVCFCLAGCDAAGEFSSGCAFCHRGIEHASPNHLDCGECHGGNPRAWEKRRAHHGMSGKKNPADPRVWEKTCGRCHFDQFKRVQSTLMATGRGMIYNTQLTWEGVDGRDYAARPVQVFDADGKPLGLNGVEEMNHISGEIYRKGCVNCHVGLETNQVWAGSHASGCAACHFSFNDEGTYRGGDESMCGKWPYTVTHRMSALPDNRVCLRCHNRSGRLALSYQGLNDGNNGLVPTSEGGPGPEMIGGRRNATHIAADIHFDKGLECIDCHTSRDLMGDGYSYRNMYHQVEITCGDCHGGPDAPPRTARIEREDAEPLRESRNYARPMVFGDEMVLTAKGRMYSNVRREDGKLWVIGKRDGKRHESKVVTGTPEHAIAGHQRLECYSCHSQAVPQCFGCHTEYDLGKKQLDHIKGYETRGAFSETEDYRSLYPFPLALNQRGRISPVTPGCQTFVTVRGAGGEVQKDEYVARFKGQNQLRFAPFYAHNTGAKAVGCGECHANPAFLGFGQGGLAGGTIEPTLICPRSGERPLDGFITMNDGRVKAFSAITREESRPLNGEEVRRVLAVNLCLVCHADPKDPIYARPLDYRRLER